MEMFRKLNEDVVSPGLKRYQELCRKLDKVLKIFHINEVCTSRWLLRRVKTGLQPPVSAGCCIRMNARNILVDLNEEMKAVQTCSWLRLAKYT